MATPHLAGTVALLWSAAPALKGDVAADPCAAERDRRSTRPTASAVAPRTNNNVYGEGRLDALALLNAAPIGDTGTLAGTVTARPVAPRSPVRP